MSNIVGNHLYIWSGSQSGLPNSHNDESKRKFTSCVEIMNLETGKWKQVATTGNPPLGVTAYSSAVIEKNILYFGGYCNHDRCFHNSITSLNIESLLWKELFSTHPHASPMIKRGCGMIPVKLDGKNHLFVIGGYGRSFDISTMLNMLLVIPMSTTILIYQLVSACIKITMCSVVRGIY